jgi:3-hydroxymyristoyl/3-hydroxydecanoyl-(acyl carrier protein) dehydratase
MSVFDPIVLRQRVDAAEAQLVLVVPTNLAYFEGHFPAAPVVPGVVQIKWALASARRCLGVTGMVAGVEALKFQQVMGPETEVTLDLKFSAETGKLNFSFHSGERRYGSGRVLLRAAP